MIAKTAASGGSGLHPEVLAFTSSLKLDLALLREDLLGSLAHLTMLTRQKIMPHADAESLRRGIVSIWNDAADGKLVLPDEEDVHMAVEGELAKRIGAASGVLHTARSRNDQVALDLRLHVREQCALSLEALADVLETLAEQAAASTEVYLPSYTHRQRAQPVSLAYVLCSHAAMFARDVEAVRFAASQADMLPLGSGASSGTSLPIDRQVTRGLLGFSRVTMNALDTVGDRDFALDYTYVTTRCLLHVSRIATDFIDYASQEFGFVELDGYIACGSSMMPQKKNPDLFEILRGRSGQAFGNLTALFLVLKGLPGGYNRDLQEDRARILESGPLIRTSLSMLRLGLSHVRFRPEKTRAALEGDYTQATDLAEALVRKGIPFRTAYQAVGALVRACQEKGLPLARATLEMAKPLHPAFDAEVLSVVNVPVAVGHKESEGGTGTASVRAQIAKVREAAASARQAASALPRLTSLFESLKTASLEG